ncbi:hypothetical protein ACEYYB_01765 [Paracoccus sp. p4-l81]|uniref:hypothetical protein n=1 Tax=unclassified Paracoccus (in: a-proteobacteria) TaxID=2688777 RepID=UPI0035BB33A4
MGGRGILAVVGVALLAAPVPACADAALPADWLDSTPAAELTADLLIARKIEARCRNLRVTAEAEAMIDRRAAELSSYLTERRLGPSDASRRVIAAFEAKHATSYAGTNSLCRAGFVEMTDGSRIGHLLGRRQP